jgi:hypothetical protein
LCVLLPPRDGHRTAALDERIRVALCVEIRPHQRHN